MNQQNDAIEQSRQWLLRSRRWAERGLAMLADGEHGVDADAEQVMTEALLRIISLTDPKQVRGMNNAELLSTIDLVELLLTRADFRQQLN
jgi:hypothetical protein